MRTKVELANKEFDSSKIAEFKNVWVFCEQREGKMMPTSFELISEGRKLADELGVKLCGLLLGDNIEGIAKELGGYGADEVIVCDHPLLKTYTTLPALVIYLITAVCTFGGSVLLYEVIRRIPVLRWCVLGIKKKK